VSAVLAALLLAGSVRGTVTITGKKSETLDPSRAVVWLEGSSAPAVTPGKGVMTTRDKKFTPEVLVLPAGSQVAFPNEDSIQHNAFSSSEGNRFDVGLYGPGAGKDVVLREPGVVRVYCNVHPQMAAFVVVTPTALAARAKADGTFEIDGVPPGSYQLKAWDERGGTTAVLVEVKAEGAPDVRVALDGSRFKKRPHLDKNGRSYDERGATDYP
jgi:plastocyanin